jgi:hypothetical protein
MDWAETVRRTREPGLREEFSRRAETQAASLRAALAAGEYGGGFALGLELEGYAVDAEGRLTRVPDQVFGSVCERELGRHNVEVNTPASGMGPAGVDAQADALVDRLAAVTEALGAHDARVVTDGMWTRGPPEGALAYLTATEATGDGPVPANMSPKARYYALDADITAAGPVELAVPGCRRAFESILVESLAMSMQVHVQTPVDGFAGAFNAALRTTGPVLALGANAPFLPPELYTDPDPETVLAAGVELRIPVFEAMNVREPGKVRFPRDLEEPGDAVDHVIEDRLCAPFLREWSDDGTGGGDEGDEFAADHFEFLHKNGTCWRWVRPVFGPDGPRIEYRVLASQPTAADVVAFQALVAGLIHGAVATDHPVLDLEWAAARDALYAAAREGLDADLAWVTRAGDRVSDPGRVYPDLFALARAGLRDRGFDDASLDGLLAPVEKRWARRTTPSDWKRDRVRDRLADGTDLAAAITGTQDEYVRRCRGDAPFVSW